MTVFNDNYDIIIFDRITFVIDSASGGYLSEAMEHMRLNFGPLILISVGALLLLSNLDILPLGKVKNFAATWWPLILIIIGALQLRKGG